MILYSLAPWVGPVDLPLPLLVIFTHLVALCQLIWATQTIASAGPSPVRGRGKPIAVEISLSERGRFHAKFGTCTSIIGSIHSGIQN